MMALPALVAMLPALRRLPAMLSSVFSLPGSSCECRLVWMVPFSTVISCLLLTVPVLESEAVLFSRLLEAFRRLVSLKIFQAFRLDQLIKG